MKKSRLNIFKSSSLVISLLGILMIVATLIVAGYIGFNVISGSLSGSISNSNQYDEYNVLATNFSDLEGKFNTTKVAVYASGDDVRQQKYAEVNLELQRAKNSLNAVSSALSSGKPSSEINTRLNEAKHDLSAAHDAFNNFQNDYPVINSKKNSK